MLASYLMKICCRLWFLVGKHVPLMPYMKPKAAKEIAASEGSWFFRGRRSTMEMVLYFVVLLCFPIVPDCSELGGVFPAPAISG